MELVLILQTSIHYDFIYIVERPSKIECELDLRNTRKYNLYIP